MSANLRKTTVIAVHLLLLFVAFTSAAQNKESRQGLNLVVVGQSKKGLFDAL